MRSIEESRFYIIVFSKNYASSSWCLEELVKIMECQKTAEQTAYPVFYDVEPTEVRNQTGAVGEAFAKHVEKEGIGRWRDALKEATGLVGWELKNTVDGHEAKFIHQIVQYISPKLHFVNLRVDQKVVGSSLESICGLRYLRELRVEGSIREVPKDMWRLECVEKLSFRMKEIKHLPDSICMFKHLKYLEVSSCLHLEQLPENICSLKCLEELHLKGCTSLLDIPNGICYAMGKNKFITSFFKRKNEEQVEGIGDGNNEIKRQKASTSEPINEANNE
ncbi:disease resistance protein RUN1-like [Helianthus annuus]|uniref:disease resistance protein RUN1-like n=1 Tax=Helianthus annuus TaxID=4232 RepID=UPI000B901F48|nr:disease resistance protein RUN1-like [Helianthus annuus]